MQTRVVCSFGTADRVNAIPIAFRERIEIDAEFAARRNRHGPPWIRRTSTLRPAG